MIIIAQGAAKEILDQQELQELLQRYDHAQDKEGQEAIAVEINRVTGDRTRAMLARSASGRPMDDEQLGSLAMQATFEALRELQPRFKRNDTKYSDWTNVIEKLRGAASGPMRKIWSLIPEPTRQAVNKPYVKATDQDQFIAALNQHVLPRRDLLGQEWIGVSLPPEAGELMRRGPAGLSNSETMRLNALLLQAIFPGDVVNVPALRKDLADDFFKVLSFVAKRMKPELWAASGSKATSYDVDAWYADQARRRGTRTHREGRQAPAHGRGKMGLDEPRRAGAVPVSPGAATGIWPPHRVVEQEDRRAGARKPLRRPR